ncbi:Low-density lipoprotein receptor-related protein 2 [Liparis tanakae]|uniref:Low-density lipoprotein receptor-related protein 2 n=1 Tax=Liparis tanakae TaxID=230148 RepID=A0A4Z2ED05_9TELE|nr:Low-density lipoprotein receptor-related protein 2 [Liparis tanakae]
MQRCDHVNDCGDGSDELGCTYDTCSSSQFTCSNGACVPAAYTCDGQSDCTDGSDEAESLCVPPQPTCAPQQYMCKSGECVDDSKVCNGQKDCSDNSDEKGCGVNECRNPSVHKCAQLCTDTLTGYYCSCQPGYRLMPDGKACEDLDECSATPAVCSQLCDNTFGSFHCKCAPGYIREPDGRTCRQNSGVAPYLLYSNRYYIRNMTTDGSHLSLVLQGLSNVVALDFDDYEKRLYWLDAGAGRIERMRFDGTGRETLAEDGILGAEGLALDWVARWVKREEPHY